MPTDMINDNVTIIDHHNSPGLSIKKPWDHMEVVVMLKQKVFTFVVPLVW